MVTLGEELLKKIFIRKLNIEITRKCNFKCEHCMRGEAQNIDMSEEMVEKILENYFMIYHLEITGGEPLLNVPLIRKIFETLEKNNIGVKCISITTNGSIRSKDLADLINRYSIKYKNIEFNYSSDLFHKSQMENWEEEINKSVEFYKEYGIVLKDLKNPASYEILSFNGRAKKLKGQIKRFKWDKKLHMVAFIDREYLYEIPESSLYYSANGNIYLSSMHSFEDVDNEKIGNVMDAGKNIIDMIFYWNRKYPITEREYGIYKFFKGQKELNGYKGGKKEEEITEFMINRFELLLELRKNLIADFPQYTTQQIIECTPVDKYVYPGIINLFDKTNK